MRVILVAGLTWATGAASVSGRVVEAVQAEEAAIRAAKAAVERRQQQDQDDQHQGDKNTPDTPLIVQHCEWDRVVKVPAPPVQPQPAPVRLPAAGQTHHPPRYELARAAPSAGLLLAATGVLLDDVPHAPPA